MISTSALRRLATRVSFQQQQCISAHTAQAIISARLNAYRCTGNVARPLPSAPSRILDLGSPTLEPIEKAKAMHPEFYTNAEWTHAERERIFGTNWFAVAHEAELAKPGDVKIIDVGETSLVLTRDSKGNINAFYNSCRHRGARVCQADASGLKQLVCPYHWWAYRLDGSLKSTPPAAMAKGRKDELHLKRVPHIDAFAGIVFVNQQQNAPPLLDVLGDLPSKLARYDLTGSTLAGSKDYLIKGDWKLIAENFCDFYHINAVHPELAKFSRVDDHLPYQGRGQYVGFVTTPLTDSGGAGDSYNFNSYEGLKTKESTSALFFHIFPNISLTIYPHSIYTLMSFPSQTAGLTKERLVTLMAPNAKLATDSDEVYKQKCKKLLAFVEKINDEDVDAIENLQVGLTNAGAQNLHGEFIPKYDWPIHRFQNMVLKGVDGEIIDRNNVKKYDDDFDNLNADVADESGAVVESSTSAEPVISLLNSSHQSQIQPTV